MKYLVSSFTAGEVSPKALGRYDIQNYVASCRTITNGVVLPQGGVTKIPGTKYIGTAETTGETLLIPWELTPTTGVVLEANTRGFRVWEDDSVKQSGGSDLEVDWPSGNAYEDSDVQKVRHTVTNRRGFLTHGDYEVNQIDYAADTDNWSVAKATYVYTNYGGTNTIEVNGDTGLAFATNPPKCSTIYEERLVFANTPENGAEDWYFASVLNGYVGSDLDFSNATTEGNVDEEAIARVLHAKRRGEIMWTAGGQALLLGTSYGVWRVAGPEIVFSTANGGYPRLQGGVGSADVEAEVVDDLIVFVDRSTKHVHAVQYVQDADKYVTNDLTFWADHIANAGIKQIVYQQAPLNLLWCVLEDGTCAVFSYNRSTGMHAWSTVDIQGTVENMAVFPGETEDQVYFLVKRTIDGSTAQYIEKLATWDWDTVEESCYLHSAKQLDGGDAFYISSIAKGDAGTSDPAQVTSETDITSSNLSADDYVRFIDTGDSELDGNVFIVKNADTSADTFDLYYRDGSSPVYLDADTDYSGDSDSTARFEVVYNKHESMSHLEGETVQALLDGGVSAETTVDGGTATFETFANKISVGLAYDTIVEPADIREAPGYVKRISNLWMKFYKTYGCKIGPDADNLAEVPFGDEAFTFDEPPEMKTQGIKSSFPGNFEYQGKVYIKHDTPHPFTVLSFVAEVEVGG